MKRGLHNPTFKVTVALTAPRGKMTMSDIMRKFNVLPVRVTQWKKQLKCSAGVVFDEENQITDDHEWEVL